MGNRIKTTEMSPEQGRSKKTAHARSTPPSRQAQLSLQNTMGNKAVNRLIQCALPVSQPGDPMEREAERIAEKAVYFSHPFETTGVDPTGSHEQSPLKQLRQAPTAPSKLPKIISRALKALTQPLNSKIRSYMEPLLGYDLSKVRVHQGIEAEKAARIVNANAFTLGQDIVFGAVQYPPVSNIEKGLLAHELAHVVQQGAGRSPHGIIARHPGDNEESEIIPAGTDRPVESPEITEESSAGFRQLEELTRASSIDPLTDTQQRRLEQIVSGVPVYEMIKERDRRLAALANLEMRVHGAAVIRRPLFVPTGEAAIVSTESRPTIMRVHPGVAPIDFRLVPRLSPRPFELTSESRPEAIRPGALTPVPPSSPIGRLWSRFTRLATVRTLLHLSTPLGPLQRRPSESSAQREREQLTNDILTLDRNIAVELGPLGIHSSDTLVHMVEQEFPELWVNRAKEIAIAELQYSREQVITEQRRYPGDVCSVDVNEVRAADLELGEIARQIINIDDLISTLEEAERYERGYYQFRPEAETMLSERAELESHRSRRNEIVQQLRLRRSDLGREFPILFAPAYRPGILQDASDEQISQMTGAWIQEVLDNISETIRNIEEDIIQAWHFHPHIREVTYQSLGIPQDSVLGVAVEQHCRSLRSNDEMLNIAVLAAEITLTILAAGFFPAALPFIGVAFGIYGAAESYEQVRTEEAAQRVALEPEQSDISTGAPAYGALAISVAALALDIGGISRVGRQVWRALGQSAPTAWHRALVEGASPDRLRVFYRDILEPSGSHYDRQLADRFHELSRLTRSTNFRDVDRAATGLTELEGILRRRASRQLAEQLNLPQEVLEPFLRVRGMETVRRMLRPGRSSFRRAVEQMDAENRRAFALGVEELVETRPGVASRMGDFVQEAARSPNPAAFLENARWLVRRNISSESLEVLGDQVARGQLDLDWLRTRTSLTDDELNFLGADPLTDWATLRRSALSSTPLSGGQIRRLRWKLRGAAAELVFRRQAGEEIIPELRQLEYTTHGGSADFTVRGFGPGGVPRLVEVKGTAPSTWSQYIHEYVNAGSHLGRLPANHTLRRTLRQLRTARTESGQRPVLVVTDALARTRRRLPNGSLSPLTLRQELEQILRRHRISTDIRTIPESEILSTRRRFEQAFRLQI